ncbi:MAG: hypothetical protein KAI39_12140 [Desulfobulbaceae bacterium]|nr:hypothetical protein [Desulfobulbaceae bacterium]
MQLMTKKLEKEFSKYAKENGELSEMALMFGELNPFVVARYFVIGGPTWYAVSYDSMEQIFLGLVHNPMFNRSDWKQFSLGELESATGLLGGVELDKAFVPIRISEIQEELNI